MATQGKAKFVSKGLRISCKTNKNKIPAMSQAKFLQLSAQGGNRVHNDQLGKAMVAVIVHKKSNPETAKAIVAQLLKGN